MASTAEPGWYDDGTGKTRWWDGARWTDQYADFGGATVELRRDSGPPPRGVAQPGWYDDGHGRTRWWDGRAWTRQTRYSGSQEDFAGIVVDGRWIHCGDLSQPIGHVSAVLATIDDLSKRPSLSHAIRMRTLATPSGPMTPRQFARLDRRTSVLAVESASGLWLTFVTPPDEPRARQFASWINASADHYRFG